MSHEHTNSISNFKSACVSSPYLHISFLYYSIGRNLKESLSKRVDCSQYPSVADKLSTDATPITQPTTVPSSMDPSTKPTEKPSQVSLATEQPTILFPDQPSRITSSAISLSLQRLSLFLSLMILCVAVIL